MFRRISPGPRRPVAGVTMVELAATAAVILILTAIALPMAEIGIKRAKEMELRSALRSMRGAIDLFHLYATDGLISPLELEPTQNMYPKTLEQLVEGVRTAKTVDTTIKFLRRIPLDPMTNSTDWGMRSYQDDVDARMWGRENVYDIYTTSEAEALNGTMYKDW
jgi:general secretion pathway protein G